jgi:hypothetical protein
MKTFPLKKYLYKFLCFILPEKLYCAYLWKYMHLKLWYLFLKTMHMNLIEEDLHWKPENEILSIGIQ